MARDNLSDFVVIRFELDRMKKEFMHAVQDYEGDLSTMIDQAMAEAVGMFPALIRQEAERTVREVVKRTFDRAEAALVWDEDVAALVREKLTEKMKEGL